MSRNSVAFKGTLKKFEPRTSARNWDTENALTINFKSVEEFI